MSTQSVLDQKCCQAAAAAAFVEGLSFQASDYTRRERHIQPLRFSRLGHFGCRRIGLLADEPFLEFAEKRMENGHEGVTRSPQYRNETVFFWFRAGRR